MHYRPLGRIGYDVSEIGFGAWAIGADWGDVDDTTAMATLHAAIDAGVNFIFNMFRQRAADRFFELAAQANVGVIVRVPLASGLLTGKMTADSTFSADDHRSYNRNGEAFDVGETFAGVHMRPVSLQSQN
jgi:aryl-alcohol dehydrogenase-like predicted oxidoreductase